MDSNQEKERMTPEKAMEHHWIVNNNTEFALSKAKLKRYVIKKRWIKAANTIIALHRMGAKLERD
ncbi:hypothetical protein LSTR_LSTR014438 [Laodelphax striatellus]|uniref:Uncharacterized protein n=1 Tax=Laodelphax striatellus TaxID=195883 RepID=A0A482XM12_LAOST|nr:hypothetical protein LSTR_LSTR014438 [Laodelphax striatellus]